MNCCIDIRAHSVGYVDLLASNLDDVSLDALRLPSAELCGKVTESAELFSMAVSQVSLDVKHICSFNSGAVMVVSPEYVWLNEDNDFSANFDVISNVDWNIE